jgi:hypothetical protein
MSVFRKPGNYIQQLLAFVVLASSLNAGRGGFILGIVGDRSGAIVAGAEVRIQSQDTGARQKLYCDSAGSYSSSELPQGLYRIRVRSEGFLTKSHSDVTVFAGKTERVDFMIDVLPMRQEMTVSAAPSNIDPAVSGLR